MSEHKTKTHHRAEDQPQHPRDVALDQELDDSFPASDPPQSTQPHVKSGGPHRAEDHGKDKKPAHPRERAKE
jgi:hypothetical protein